MEYKSLSDQLSAVCSIPQEKVDSLFNALTNVIGEAASQMEVVSFPSFGNLEPKKRTDRISINPATGKKMLIPPKIVLGFRPSTLLKQKIRNI